MGAGGIGQSDEMLARMLQDEENAQSRGLPLGPRSMFLGLTEMQVSHFSFAYSYCRW